MQIVIDILDKDIPKTQDMLEVDFMFIDGHISQCTYPFEVLEQEPKTGHWVIYDVHGHKACKCSECGTDAGYPCNDKYCRHCGSYNGGERI